MNSQVSLHMNGQVSCPKMFFKDVAHISNYIAHFWKEMAHFEEEMAHFEEEMTSF